MADDEKRVKDGRERKSRQRGEVTRHYLYTSWVSPPGEANAADALYAAGITGYTDTNTITLFLQGYSSQGETTIHRSPLSYNYISMWKTVESCNSTKDILEILFCVKY